MNKITLLQHLIRVSDALDNGGLDKEAAVLDDIMVKVAQEEEDEDSEYYSAEKWEEFNKHMREMAQRAIEQVDYEFRTFPFKDKVWNLMVQWAENEGLKTKEVDRWIRSSLSNLLMQSALKEARP